MTATKEKPAKNSKSNNGPRRVKKTIVVEQEVELIPSSRTGRVGDEDAKRVELFVDGVPVESFQVDGVTVDLQAGYYADERDLDIIMASFVQRKRVSKKQREAEAAAAATNQSSDDFHAQSVATTEGMVLPESHDGGLPVPAETPDDPSAAATPASRIEL